MEINPKLEMLIKEFFSSFNGQNTFCEVADLNGTLLFLNDYFEKRNLQLSQADIGSNLFSFVKKQGPIYSHNFVEELYNLYQAVIKNKIRKSFYAYARDKAGNCYVRQASVFPIIGDKGEVIGTYALSFFANPLRMLRPLQQELNKSTTYSDYKFVTKNYRLTFREQEILFLLLYNFSQNEIAQLLNISRATVQKTISTRICSKLQVDSFESSELIHKASALKLHDYFPPSLLKKHLIELADDNDIVSALRLALKVKQSNITL